MLKGNLKLLLGFGIGLAVASVIPVRATTTVLREMKAPLLAQAYPGNFTENSLQKLATCLDNSGFTANKGGTAREVSQDYRDGVVSNKGDRCLYIREEGTIQSVIRCMPNGEGVQVLLKQGEPITTTYQGSKFVFVISYSKGDKGWASADSISY